MTSPPLPPPPPFSGEDTLGSDEPGGGSHDVSPESSLKKYVVPSAVEIPSIDVVHVEAELPNTIGGFRGLGEGGTIGAPACIANAISDALSPLEIEISEIPATPERLFRLIDAARQA